MARFESRITPPIVSIICLSIICLAESASGAVRSYELGLDEALGRCTLRLATTGVR